MHIYLHEYFVNACVWTRVCIGVYMCAIQCMRILIYYKTKFSTVSCLSESNIIAISISNNHNRAQLSTVAI